MEQMCFTLTKQQMNRMEAAEMRFFRAVLRYDLIDQNRNSDPRK